MVTLSKLGPCGKPEAPRFRRRERDGVAEVPLTEIAAQAMRDQLVLSGPGPWLFPSSKYPDRPQGNFKKTWERTLRKAGVPYFRLYDLRSTYATSSAPVALPMSG